MKKKLFAIVMIAALAACNGNKPDATTTDAVDSNRSALDQSQTINTNGLNDTIVTSTGDQYVKVDPNAPAPSKPTVKTIVKYVPTKAPVKATTTTTTSTSTGTTTTTTGSNPNHHHRTTSSKYWILQLLHVIVMNSIFQSNHDTIRTTVNTGTGNTVGTGTGTTTTTTTTKEPEKTGMSNATKGAIIGGVTGAVAGAIISKKKGTGAIVGGLAGAAGGFLIGKSKDKKKAAADSVKQ